MSRWAALWMILAIAATAPAADAGARAGRVRAHDVPIAKSQRVRPITQRMLRLPYLRKLGVPEAALRERLSKYRSVRQRGRELRARLPRIMRSKVLVKTDSFIVERHDFRSTKPGTRPKILMVGGVHAGSEPVGVEVAMKFAESLGSESWLEHFDITIVPAANPKGLMRSPGTVSKGGNPGRYTAEGIDLNRTFAAGKWTAESRALARMMRAEKFDAVLDLHSAGPKRNGFFAIRAGPDGGAAGRFMSKLGRRFPLLNQRGAGKTYRVEKPGVVTSSNVGTLKQFAHSVGARFSYTFEAPTRLPAAQQVDGQMTMVRAALEELRNHL